ncbi:hypothetical protein JT05_07540 [Desulfosporosinus sp. Tol-M]|jgi:hypothetical protein|nr:hypothetical protein JT05_07540 [Desulfosporosinus sp. Tol-M]
MKTLVKKFLLSVSPPKRPQPNETECLIAEIEEARGKILYAWNRFDYAAPEYVELAVLELLLSETHYSLLNKRYRIMLGINTPLLSLDGHFQNHAFFGTISDPSASHSQSPDDQSEPRL